MLSDVHFVRWVGAFALGFMFANASACSCKREDEMAKCEGFVEEPSEGFPIFGEGDGATGSEIGFQVCDSVAVDLNGDNRLDFVSANHINAGFGYFAQRSTTDIDFGAGVSVPFSGGSNSAGIIAHDFNGDGILDIANSGHEGVVTIRINGTAPGSAPTAITFPSAGETDVDLGINHGPGHGFAGVEGGLVGADFNADGKVDFATSNLGLNAAMQATSSVVLNTTPDPTTDGMGNPIYPAASTFGPVQYVELPGPAISITTADFNADGTPDLATSNTAVSSVSILTNATVAGDTTVSFTRLDLEIPADGNSAGAGPTNPVAADFNNDGKPDVVTANWNVDTITLFTNTTAAGGPTEFTAEPFTVDLCFNPLVVRNGDLDSDGDEDIVIVPLDLTSSIAVGIVENQLEAGSDIPQLALVELVYLPKSMQRVSFFDWLEGKSGGMSPGIWFTSTGNAADFDDDGNLEILLAVAYGNFAIEMQAQLTKTDNILEYVVPPINMTIANQFLPMHTELLYLVPQ